MKKIISFSGKGGVGKSTLLVLMLKYLLEDFKDLNILVIDADPDANIGDIIGKEIHFKETVGGKMEQLKRRIQKRQIPLDVSKDQIIESEVFDALIEMDEFVAVGPDTVVALDHMRAGIFVVMVVEGLPPIGGMPGLQQRSQ